MCLFSLRKSDVPLRNGMLSAECSETPSLTLVSGVCCASECCLGTASPRWRFRRRRWHEDVTTIEFIAISSCWCCRGSCYGIHRNLIDTEHVRSNNKQDEDILTAEVFVNYKTGSVPQCYSTFSNYDCVRNQISTKFCTDKHNSRVLWFWALGFERAHSSILRKYSWAYPVS